MATLDSYPDNVRVYLEAIARAFMLAPEQSPQDWAAGKLHTVLENECQRYRVESSAILETVGIQLFESQTIFPIVDSDE